MPKSTPSPTANTRARYTHTHTHTNTHRNMNIQIPRPTHNLTLTHTCSLSHTHARTHTHGCVTVPRQSHTDLQTAVGDRERGVSVPRQQICTGLVENACCLIRQRKMLSARTTHLAPQRNTYTRTKTSQLVQSHDESCCQRYHMARVAVS